MRALATLPQVVSFNMLPANVKVANKVLAIVVIVAASFLGKDLFLKIAEVVNAVSIVMLPAA